MAGAPRRIILKSEQLLEKNSENSVCNGELNIQHRVSGNRPGNPEQKL